jgi:hypothetical protein
MTSGGFSHPKPLGAQRVGEGDQVDGRQLAAIVGLPISRCSNSTSARELFFSRTIITGGLRATAVVRSAWRSRHCLEQRIIKFGRGSDCGSGAERRRGSTPDGTAASTANSSVAKPLFQLSDIADFASLTKTQIAAVKPTGVRWSRQKMQLCTLQQIHYALRTSTESSSSKGGASRRDARASGSLSGYFSSSIKSSSPSIAELVSRLNSCRGIDINTRKQRHVKTASHRY